MAKPFNCQAPSPSPLSLRPGRAPRLFVVIGRDAATPFVDSDWSTPPQDNRCPPPALEPIYSDAHPTGPFINAGGKLKVHVFLTPRATAQRSTLSES